MTYLCGDAETARAPPCDLCGVRSHSPERNVSESPEVLWYEQKNHCFSHAFQYKILYLHMNFDRSTSGFSLLSSRAVSREINYIKINIPREAQVLARAARRNFRRKHQKGRFSILLNSEPHYNIHRTPTPTHPHAGPISAPRALYFGYSIALGS